MRRNPGDDDLRRLQRVALEQPGDVQAQAAYLAAWRRAGEPDLWPDRDPTRDPVAGDVVDVWYYNRELRRYEVLGVVLGRVDRRVVTVNGYTAPARHPSHGRRVYRGDPGWRDEISLATWRSVCRGGPADGPPAPYVERAPSPWPKPTRPRRSRKNPPAWARYPRTYVSPRSRALTADESRVRDVTVALKHGDPAAVEVAAHAMARFVPRGAVLVPAPSSTPGSYSGTDVLARRLAELTASEVRCLVGRQAPVESSRTRRRAGGKGLTSEEHAASMVLLEDPVRYARRPLVLVDNVVVSGATLEGMKRVLGRPDLAVVAYSGAEEVRRNPGGDRRLRDLERRARQGDLEAVAHLAHEQQRRTHDRGLLLGVDDPRVRDVVQTYLWTTLDNWHDQHEYRAVNNWPNDMAMALAAHVVAQDWAAQGNAPANYLADVYAYDSDHEATLEILRGLTMADLLLVLEHVVPRSERERLLTGAGLLMSEHHANLLRNELGFLVDILWQVPR